MAAVRPGRPAVMRRMRQNATAIIVNRIVQTGPNTQFGGVNDGFAIWAYQVGIFGMVASAADRGGRERPGRRP